MNGKPDNRIRDLSPGPGIYEPSTTQTKEKVKTFKIGESKRTEIVSKEVSQQIGPGHYDSPSKFGDKANSVSLIQRFNLFSLHSKADLRMLWINIMLDQDNMMLVMKLTRTE